jgi:hypothetical protein
METCFLELCLSILKTSFKKCYQPKIRVECTQKSFFSQNLAIFFKKKEILQKNYFKKVFYFFHFGNFLHQNKFKKLKKIASPKKQRQTSNGI